MKFKSRPTKQKMLRLEEHVSALAGEMAMKWMMMELQQKVIVL